MNKKFTTIFSVLIIVVFIAYIIFDTTRPAASTAKDNKALTYDTLPEKWKICRRGAP